MFGWRKRADGFEWNDYVRTTILVRRNERRQKIDKAREDAFAHAEQLGRQGVEAAKAKISQAGQKAGAIVRPAAATVLTRLGDGLVYVFRSIWRGLSLAFEKGGEAFRKGFDGAGSAAGHAGRAISDVGGSFGQSAWDRSVSSLSRLWDLLSRGDLAVPASVVAVGAMVDAIGEYFMRGLSTLAIVAIGVAIVCGVYALIHSPSAGAKVSNWLRVGWDVVSAFFSRLIQAGAISATAVAVAILGVGYWISSPPSDVRSPAQRSARTAEPVKTTSKPAVDASVVSGFARSLTGDTFRIDGTTIKLAGVEAPALDQRCDRGNSRTWRCGQGALQALRRITGRNDVTCELSGKNAAGDRVGTCLVGDRDIAAELVRNGHVFAMPGFFAPYGSQEDEAQAKKVGIWRGEAVRPSDIVESH